MKKQFIIGMILIGFINTTLIPASAAQQTMQSNLLGTKQRVVRWWQCATAPKKNKCDVQEAENARKWLLGSAAAALVIILAAAGIAGVTVRKVRQAQEQRMRDNQEQRMRDDLARYEKELETVESLIEGQELVKAGQELLIDAGQMAGQPSEIDLNKLRKEKEESEIDLNELRKEKKELEGKIENLKRKIAIREGKLKELYRQREVLEKEVDLLGKEIKKEPRDRQKNALGKQQSEKREKIKVLTDQIRELGE